MSLRLGTVRYVHYCPFFLTPCLRAGLKMMWVLAGSSTRLHTRISARVILKWVSPLPGETVLDCLLPDDWKKTGFYCECLWIPPYRIRITHELVLHTDVLDMLSWRSLDIASNPASFRYALASIPSTPEVPQ